MKRKEDEKIGAEITIGWPGHRVRGKCPCEIGDTVTFRGMECLVLKTWYDDDSENEGEEPNWRARVRILKLALAKEEKEISPKPAATQAAYGLDDTIGRTLTRSGED